MDREYLETYLDEPSVAEKLAELDRRTDPARLLWSPVEWLFAAAMVALLAASVAVQVMM
jgi:hypothetical protein